LWFVWFACTLIFVRYRGTIWESRLFFQEFRQGCEILIGVFGYNGITWTHGSLLAMNAGMAIRIRLIIDTEEELRRAVQIRAAATGKSPSEVLNELIQEQFRKEIAQARQAMRAEGNSPDDD
jgi:hypothetical protein